MPHRITYTLLILLFLCVTPAQAVQIEESFPSPTVSWSIEESSYIENSINAYSLKKNNTTTTPVVNGTGGLAPLEKTSEIEEGFSTLEIVGIIVFIVIILWGICTMSAAVFDINHCKSYIATAPAQDLKTLETCAARVDGCVELIDNIQTINEWCVNLEDQLVQFPEDPESIYVTTELGIRYIPQDGLYYGIFPKIGPGVVSWQYISPLEKISREYDNYYQAYEEYSHIVDKDTYTPEWRFNQIVPGESYSIAGYPISYNRAILNLRITIGIISFGALGLATMLLRKYLH